MRSPASTPAPELRLAVCQFAPRLRDVAANAARIAEAAAAHPSSLLITPELSLTGYDLKDDVHSLACPLPAGAKPGGIWGAGAAGLEQAGTVLVGARERASDAVPYNTAVLIEQGRIAFVHRKIYLPTYGMFDEGRYFGRGSQVDTFVIDGWRCGILVCEDFWHPMLAYLHALQGIHLLIVMAAAPGRGAWAGGEDGGFFASSDSWERIARTCAQLYGIYVVVCNRVGVEGAVTFAGESLAVAPDASVMVRAGVEEETFEVTLEASALTAARTPYAHIRDEDAALAVREIQRILAQ